MVVALVTAVTALVASAAIAVGTIEITLPIAAHSRQRTADPD
jgi:hypothetical protein